MSQNRLVMQGLDELRYQLRQLPHDLAEEAADVVIAHAEAARQEIIAGYPIGPGSTRFPPGVLRARVTALKNRTLVATSVLVRSRAPHAHLFEYGTRRRITDKGYNRGRMPKAPVDQAMIPKIIRWRSRMVAALIAVVRKAGLQVNEAA